MEYKLKKPQKYLKVTRKKNFRVGDWILVFRLGKTSASELEWYFADCIVSVPKTDKKAYDPNAPFEVIQFWPNKRYPQPPFKINGCFRNALSRAVKEFGSDKIKQYDPDKAPWELVDLIEKHWSESGKD